MTRFKSKRSKATDFSKKVKIEMLERDNHRCIYCRTGRSLTPAHYIGRGQGGLGIIENGACVCMKCHTDLDHSIARTQMLIVFKAYLKSHYPNFKDSERIFKKGVEYLD